MQVSIYAQVGFIVTRIKADDVDVGVNAMLVYDVIKSAVSRDADAPPAPFDVDANNGAVYVKSSLRHWPRSKEFVLPITVRDSGSPALTSSASLVITLNDSLTLAAAQGIRLRLRLSSSSSYWSIGRRDFWGCVTSLVFYFRRVLIVVTAAFIDSPLFDSPLPATNHV